MGRVGDRVLMAAEHDGVSRQSQGVVVCAIDGGHGVAKVAGDTLRIGWDFVQVEAVRREPQTVCHRGMALDAEVTKFASCLTLASGVHREEDRIEGGVGVHAAGPFVVVRGVAPAAGLGIHELLLAEARRDLSDQFFIACSSRDETPGEDQRDEARLIQGRPGWP